MKSRAGSAYIWCSGRVGRTSAEAAGSGPNISARTRRNGDAAATSGDWFSAATASGSQSQARSVSRWPCAMSQSVTVPAGSAVTVPDRRSSRRARRSGPASFSAATRSPPRDRVPVEHGGEQVQRRGQRRAAEHRSAALGIEVRHFHGRLDAHVVERLDPSQELERRAIAAEEHVLTVVDELAGFAIGESRGPAAELRPRIQHLHAHAAPGERRGRAQPRETPADHDDVRRPVIL